MTVEPVPAIDERFDLIERVGSGAFGEVWRALDRDTGESAAIKRLHAHLSDGAAITRFLREASLLARVRSEHVVRYIAHGRDDNARPWIATEWLSGEDLNSWRTSDGATLSDAVGFVRDAARGAQALHAVGIIHRDLKPTNVFVAKRADGSRVAKIVDLGIAHGLDVTVLTQTGTILGSPSYMAPEQVRGDAIDGRVDMWALGVVLYELVLGEPPFGTTNAIAVLGRVLLEPVPVLRTLRNDLPPDLEALIEQLLEKSRDRRVQTAQELADRLDATLTTAHDSPALSGPPAARRSSSDLQSTQQQQLHGERRLVALLFARVESGEPERATRAAIERYGGRAEPLRGAWLGGFGLVRARGDELVAAARAARDAQAAGASVALVTGWAEVRVGGLLAGQLIERGALLLDEAVRGEVRVPHDAVARLDGQFVFELIAAGVYRLVRERAAGSMRPPGAPPPLLGRSVPVLGREKELRLLEGVYLECVDDQALRLALVIGEAGLGKSRLRYEIGARLANTPAPPRSLSFGGEPMLADVAHGLFTKGLREAAGIEDGAAPEDARNALHRFVAAHVTPPELHASFLGELLRVPSIGDASTAMRAARQDPFLMRQRVRESIAAVMRRMATDAPLLVTLDDLQWCDGATIDLLAWLFEELRSAPITFLAFARPEIFDRHPVLWHGTARTELKLSPLSQRVSEQIVSTVLEVDEVERRAIVTRAGGNPLFLEALIRARADGVQELPVAVQSAMQVRLDALGDDARRLAQLASVLGATFWLEGVAAMRPQTQVAATVAELVRAEIVVERHASRFASTREYAFAHGLVRDAAYAMLIASEASELHGRAAQWLERMGESDPAVIGHHYQLGRRLEDAAKHFARAAANALAESAYESADTYATRALDCSPPREVAIEMLLLRAEARRALGRSAEMLADARSAESMTRGDPSMEIEARSRVAQALGLLGSLDEAEEILRSVLEESHATLVAPRVQALLELARVDLAMGRGHEAGALLDEALSFLEQAGSGFEYQRLLALRARSSAYACIGDHGRALDAAYIALEACTTAGHRARGAEALTTLGRALLRVGAIEEARERLESAIAEARALRLPGVEGHAVHALGDVLAVQGDLAGAIASQERGMELGRQTGATRLRLSSFVHRCMHTLDRGRAEDARAVIEAASRTLPETAPFAPLRCILDAVLARAELLVGHIDRAIIASERAEETLRALGSVEEYEEYIRTVHVLALDAAGRSNEAETALYHARERLQRKAAKIRDAGRRRTYLEAIPNHRALQQLARRKLGSKS